MNKPSLFVILIPGFPDSESDTNCLPFQQKFVKAFRDHHPGTEVAVLAFQYPHTKKNYHWKGIPVFAFGGKNRGGLRRLWLRRKVFSKLVELHKKFNITGLLSFWCGECALTGKKFAKKHGLKHYCWICGQDASKENKYPSRMKADANDLVALSDFLQEEFYSNHLVKPAKVIPPGLEITSFQNHTTEKTIDLLAAGSLIPLKRFEIFIETVGVLKREFPSVKAVLAGEGPEKENLADLVRLFGLENNVEITGELPHDELLAMMQRTRLFIHPSRYEGFSGVCLEAIHAGATVISFVKPMKDKIANWMIARDKEDMQDLALRFLEKKQPPKENLQLFDITETVEKISSLYY